MNLGQLTCHVVESAELARRTAAGEAPALVVVLCHGYGAPGSDLVPLADETAMRRPELAGAVRFVLPEAPLRLNGFGWFEARAWWPIDVERYERAAMQGALRTLCAEEPEGLPRARALLEGLLADLRDRWGLPPDRIVLGGFSQGAMLATDVTLGAEEAPAGLCILSGALIAEARWRSLAPRRAGLPVLQAHGRRDPLLPFDVAVWLHDLLVEAGLQVRFVSFEGAHAVPPPVSSALADFVAERLAALR
jgi:Predicted esterase